LSLKMVIPNWLATQQCIYDFPLIIISCKGFHPFLSNGWLAHFGQKVGWCYLQGHSKVTHRRGCE
jgi:hypothetical protein